MSRWIACLQSVRNLPKQLLVFTAVLCAASLTVTEKINAQTTAQSQDPKQTVSGRITDENGKPLQGVSVQVKGSSTGTSTNQNGEYQIAYDSKKSGVLVFSYVGMEQQEISIGSKREVNVSLLPGAAQQQEVVVIGYGTQKKQAVTGAVTNAKLSTYDRVPTTNIFESVKGTIPGLNVGGTNTAGGVPSFTIRGTNSQTAGTTPLVVVDGVIFAGNFADISPNDIESFTVLKDASAAAVYGSRSANGVILIETKKGRSPMGKPQFELNVNLGTSTQMKPLEVYDAPGYIQRLLDIRAARGLEADPSKVASYLQTEEAKNYNATPDHQPTLSDPFSLFRQQGRLMNASFSISNRTEKTRYYISGNVTNQQGVIKNDEFTRFTGRVNLESDLTKWLTMGVRTNYSFRDYPDGRIYGSVGDGTSIYSFSPYASIYNADGSYMQFPQTTTSLNSPFWQIATSSVNQNNSLNGIGTILVKVPGVKGLTYTLNASITQNWNENYSFYNSQTVVGLPRKGSGNRTYNRSTSRLVDNIVKYNRTFAQAHNVDLTLLYSYENYNSERISASGVGFDNESLGSYGLGSAATQTASTGGSETVGKGTMARLTYSFQNKYSLTGTIRRDGFSAFSENKKYGVFPSVGANWNISKENFMDHVTVVDNLALRASYGSNGNQSISPYSTLARMGNSRYLFYNDASYTYTQFISTLGNEELGWESTTGINLGLDFALFKNRVSGSLDVYSKKTHDLAFTLQLPSAGGINTIVSNVGEIGNKGIELNLTTVNMIKGDFKWTTDLAFSLNRNKVVTIYGEDKDGDGKEDDLISAGYFIGKSLGTIYNYRITGMWQQDDKDQGTIMAGMAPGTYKLEDVDKDGKITSDKDRQFLGNNRENFRWSMTNSFAYKNWSLMLLVNSIWGGNGYFLAANTPYSDAYAEAESMNRPVYDYWTPTNPGALFPRTNYSTAATYKGTKYMDRSFVRLQKASLTYNFSGLVSKYGIKGMRASLSADNLATYAPHWIGLDPETNNGISVSSIPSIRNYSMMLSFNF